MLHAANGEVLNSTGSPLLLRGVNLTPWLNPEPYLIANGLRALLLSPSELKQNLAKLVGPDEAQSFWRQWEDAFVTEADFKHLAEQGFNCVRLPINYKYMVSGTHNGMATFDKAGVEPVDRAVAWGAKYGIYIIIDLHDAPGGQNPTSTVSDVPSTDKTARLWEGPTAKDNQNLTIAAWRALAAHYAGATSVGGYDLLNEPVLPAGAPKDELVNFYKSIITAIRSVDSRHIIIVEGDKYARDYSTLAPPPDANLMYQFHEYSLFNPAWKTPNLTALARFLQLRTSSHMPLFLGEFGEDSLNWQQQMVQLMKTNRIGWAIWPWKRIEKNAPVIETIVTPNLWTKLSKYVVGGLFAIKPTPEEAQKAMSQMLQAIRTENCKEDQALASILAGK